MTIKIKRFTLCFPYRAFHNQSFNKKVVLFLLIPPVVNVLFFVSLPIITQYWGVFFIWYLEKMGYVHAVGYTDYQLFHSNFSLPYLDLYVGPPSVKMWWNMMILALIMLLVSGKVPEPYTPFKYLFRAFVFLLIFSLIYFYFFYEFFPYNIPSYSKDSLLESISLCFVTPWIYGFTYYMFSYHVIKKILITFLTIAFLLIGGMMQVVTNFILVDFFSLVFLPCTYIFFGLLFNIFMIVAFYAYGVSNEKVFSFKKEF